MTAYLAGPMRGRPLWNFPTFDSAAEYLRNACLTRWDIVSPAELDRALGFDETATSLPDGFIEQALRRDIEALLDVDTIILLPGWEKSTGANIELTVARALGHTVLHLKQDQWGYWQGPEPLPAAAAETILEEAQRLIYGDRNEAYGPPDQDFARTGRMWGAILGVDDVAPELVGLCMVAVKISREVHHPKRDNRTDGAGYFGCVDKIHQARGEQ